MNAHIADRKGGKKIRQRASVLQEVGAVIVNWNSGPWLARCVNSFVASGIPARSIVIVDAGSTDTSVADAKAMAKKVRLLRMNANPGYGAAVNAGMEVLKHIRRVFVANCDVEVSKDALEKLIHGVDSRARVAIVTPSTCTEDGRNNTHTRRTSVVALVMLLLVPRLWDRMRTARRPSAETFPRTVQFAEGSCFLVDRKAFNDIGGFDLRFHFHSEDADLSVRMLKAGWRILHMPDVRVIHAGGTSFAHAPALRLRTIVEGMLLFHWTHAPRRYIWIRRLIMFTLKLKILQIRFARESDSRRDRISPLLASVEAEVYVRPYSQPLKQIAGQPKISVIVPTYDRPGPLRTFLKELRATGKNHTEVILVEQGRSKPHDGKEFRNVKWIFQSRPHRGRAKNAGIRGARGETILICDDDLVPGRGFLRAHISEHHNSPYLGLTLRMVEEHRVSSDGPVFGITFGGRVHARPDAQRSTRVSHLAGGNMSVRRDILIRSGGFDDSYRGTAVFEEADISSRLRSLGVDLWFKSSPSSRHIPQPGGNWTERERDARRYYILFHHNLLYYLMKNGPLWILPGSLVTAGARSVRQAWSRGMGFRDACSMFSGAFSGIACYIRILKR